MHIFPFSFSDYMSITGLEKGYHSTSCIFQFFRNEKYTRQQNKRAQLPISYVSILHLSFPLLLMLAAFIQRGIIKTVWACWLTW